MQKIFYIVCLVEAQGFNGKLPFIYNATYINYNKANAVKECFEQVNPDFKYKVATIELEV